MLLWSTTRQPDRRGRAAELAGARPPRWCREHGVVLASDEAYCELYFGDPPPSALQLCDHSGVLAFHTLSKRSSMPGHRSGFVAGDPALVGRCSASARASAPCRRRSSSARRSRPGARSRTSTRPRPLRRQARRPAARPAGGRPGARRRRRVVLPLDRVPDRDDEGLAARCSSTASWRRPAPTSGRPARATLRLALVPAVEACERAAELVARLGHDLAPGHRHRPRRARLAHRGAYEKPTRSDQEDAATVARRRSTCSTTASSASPSPTRRRLAVNEWAKKAVLLTSACAGWRPIESGPFEYHDKLPLKTGFAARGVRVVPPATARHGAYLAPGVVMMPSYVNIGAWVGAGTMVDTWATVGSCAQIGADVHLSGGVGIGGVLEPLQAAPVIVEDGAFVGSRCIVVEGVRVGARAVLGANVVLTATTPIIDVRGEEKVEMRGEVPAGAIVVPGTRTKMLPAGKARLPCALIIGERWSRTDLKTSLNDALREHAVSVVSSSAASRFVQVPRPLQGAGHRSCGPGPRMCAPLPGAARGGSLVAGIRDPPRAAPCRGASDGLVERDAPRGRRARRASGEDRVRGALAASRRAASGCPPPGRRARAPCRCPAAGRQRRG